jgi:hypothetical protein
LTAKPIKPTLNLVKPKEPVIPDTTKRNQPEINGWYLARLVGELGFIIALPLVILLLLGIYLDRQFKTEVLFTLIGIFLALFFSSFVIYRKIKEIND